ncbi:IPT/TIG domain-containing protein [Pedobacter sp. MC2016-14]|uniref:IPT/TIG domain-containing protein n=1 Tax=Pedobacter sp. MC2016-14 TaxID=2897327 RepID=UPI001E3C9CE1|nr:IPT/TIG domain-containing protein [Pedobacter sp. MC2016-14]MCD0489511.1 IPT/TIG domain-containing protein [Pedobacter sp. MC2016-14]
MNTYLLTSSRKKGLRQLLLLAVVIVSIFSCKNDEATVEPTTFDPNLPVQVTTFLPDSGGIRTKFIIKGSNFGTDKSKVKVFFTDAEKDRPATIISLNNETIYCLVPKELGGYNSVKVTVETKNGSISKKFLYIVAQSVSNVVGLSGADAYVNGSLSDARMQRTFGLAALGNDELISFESLSSVVRYISVNDNKVSTLQTSFDGTHPAINAARTRIYSIGKNVPHKVYFYDKSSLWQPQILAAQIPGSTNFIWAAALDETEEWLYFRDKDGKFGRLQIANPTNVQILNPTCGPVGNTDYTYMIYSKIDQCFFISVQGVNGIYKVSKDGLTVTEYAGFNGLATIDGSRRTQAAFRGPAGMCLDAEGNIYVAEANAYVIRKINRNTEYVSTIAGMVLAEGGLNGAPLASKFSYPYCLASDPNDVIFIGESWGRTIRKLAIE